MLPDNIIGKDGKKSRIDHKARPAKIIAYEAPTEERGAQPKKLGTGTQYPIKPPGPPPAKKTQD